MWFCLSDCGRNLYCNTVLHVCESCFIICDPKRHLKHECKAFCEDFYLSQPATGRTVPDPKALLTVTSDYSAAEAFQISTTDMSVNTLILVIMTLACLICMMGLLVIATAVLWRHTFNQCFIPKKKHPLGAIELGTAMLGSKSGMSANSADPEHSNINPNVEMTDYASQNKKLLQYDQTELMLGSEENDGNHELSGNESETQLSKNCTINSNRNVVQNNDVTVRSSPTDLIQPRQNESETKGIPNNTSGGAECLSNREQEEKLGSKEADRGEESVDRRKEEILTPVYQPASALDHTERDTGSSPLPTASDTAACHRNGPSEHRMEIEGFYCSYNKDPGINLSPPKKQTHAYKDISLQEAENDPCVNREGIELVQNAIHINKKAESKEEATSVIQMRQYHEEESDTDSGRGSDETLLKDQTPSPIYDQVEQPSLAQSPQKHTERNAVHPNITACCIVNDIPWVHSVYSEGQSIYVYVDFNDISEELALQQIISKTGCDASKFHIRHQESAFPFL